MKVYFDESYPQDANIMILGALFLPNRTARYLHKKVLEIKKKYKITGELKYATIESKKQLDAAKEILDEFFAMRDGYFRAGILPYDEKGLGKITGIPLDKKRIRIYADSATKLIVNNVTEGASVEVYMDEESRLEKVKFYDKLMIVKLQDGTTIKSVIPVKSHHDGNCLMVLCDLLTGGIKQNLYPTKNRRRRRSKFKLEFEKYYLSLVGKKDFKEETWKDIKTSHARKINMKVHVGYWHVPDFEKYFKRKKAKNRS